MKSNYVIEFNYQGESIDWKESSSTPIIPRVGEAIAIMTWENPNNSQGRSWWRVKEIKHWIGKNEENTILTQKVMIEIEPDVKNGLYKSDPTYESFDYDKSS